MLRNPEPRKPFPHCMDLLVDNRNFGCAAYVRLGIFVDDLLHCQLKFAGNVKDVSGVEQDRVLVLAAFSA